VKDLPPEILAQWSKLDLTPESFLKPIGSRSPREKGRLLIEQLSSRPTCDINGIFGGYTGEGSKTVIPRKPPPRSRSPGGGQQPDRIRKAFRDYVTARLRGLHGRIRRSFQRARDRARLEHEAARRAQRALTRNGARKRC